MKEYMQRPETESDGMIEGRNAVTEALRSGTAIDKIYLAKGETDRTLSRIAAEARKAGVVVVEADRRKLDAMSRTHAHPGVIALAAVREYVSVESMLAAAAEKGENPLLVVCDEISDPHNLGAIIRTAEACGAHGVIIPKRHSAGLTAAAVKSSAGAAVCLPVVRVANLVSTMQQLKAEKNVWFTCADMDGQNWCQLDFKGAVGLVIGSEGSGVSRLVREECDFVAALPMQGQINSLNASVAGGIILYEITRQRLGLKAK